MGMISGVVYLIFYSTKICKLTKLHVQPHGTQQTSNPEVGATTSHEGRKRRQFGANGDEETNTLQRQLIEVLEKNGKMLCAQLEAQNTNFQLDREQRKDHAASLVTVLNKLADALGRIADKL
ncbi:hypothetical protein ACSBR2_006883 [Camellia fascicularis]